MPLTLPKPTAKLVIYGETGTPTLAWEVIVHTPGPTWQTFVHAKTGKVLNPARDLNRYATGTGQVFLVNAIVATHDNSLRDEKDAAAAVPSSAYRSVTLWGLDGTGISRWHLCLQSSVEAAGVFSKPVVCVRSQHRMASARPWAITIWIMPSDIFSPWAF